MDLYTYNKLLNLNNDDNILVYGVDALIIAGYLFGKSKEINKRLFVKAVIPPEARVANIVSAQSEAEKYPEKQTILEGLGNISSTLSDLETFNDGQYNKVLVITQDEDWKKILKKVNEFYSGEILILDLPFSYSRFLKTETKLLFKKKTNFMSFKSLIDTFGVKVTHYDAHDSSLIMAISGDFDKIKYIAEYASVEEMANQIKQEIFDPLPFVKHDSKFAIRSIDGEYLYFITVHDVNDEPITLNFIFSDGKNYELKEEKPKEQSKNVIVLVLPNTPTFRKELEEKDVLIVDKNAVVKLYG